MRRLSNSSPAFTLILFMSASGGLTLPAADDSEFISARNQIVSAYQRSIDALRRGDADTALQMDTDDWISTVVGQPPRTKADLAPYIRRDIESMKPSPEWKVEWRPDYEHNGTLSGIQLYDLKIEGKLATVLCLVGSTSEETTNGKVRSVWRGSHVRDTWTKTPAGWKRRKHEKLTINERMVDGRPRQ